MSAKRVEILEAVQDDLEYARSFYDPWKPGGGDEILRKYFEAFENPRLHSRLFVSIRG